MIKSKLLKKMPDNEVCMVTYRCLNGDTYKLTQNQMNKTFTMYKVVNDCFERLGKGANPTALEEKYIKR